MKPLFIIILTILFSTAHADDLLLYGKSHHFSGENIMAKPSQVYNEVNYGIGYEKGNIGVGVYKDSYSKIAKTVYAVKYFGDVENFSLGVRVGYLNGSGYKGVIVLPTIRYNVIEVSGVPGVNGADGVVAMWLHINL